jgi:hypothetical protein
LTPFPFLQFRTGLRRYEGPAQQDFENIALAFAELHAFL